MSATSKWMTSAEYKRVRLLVLDRDGWRCKIRGPHCHGWADQVDHVIPRADGGALFDPTNMRAACRPCNNGRNVGRGRLTYRTSVPTYDTRM